MASVDDGGVEADPRRCEGVGNHRLRPDIKSFDGVPTLVIHGTSDKTVPIDATGRIMAQKVPGAKLIEYDGSAHGLFATDKDRLCDDLVAFLGANRLAEDRSAIPLAETTI